MADMKTKRPNWKILNQVRRERAEKKWRAQYREVEPGVFVK